MIEKYNKLVRDKIPKIIMESGKLFTGTSPRDDYELYKYRKEKVLEEIQELLNAVKEVPQNHYTYNENLFTNCEEELVDVIESLWYLLYGKKFTKQEAEALYIWVEGKRETKGAFDKNIILKEVRDEE